MKINVTTNTIEKGVYSRIDNFEDQTDALIIENINKEYHTLLLIDTVYSDDKLKTEEIELEDGCLRSIYLDITNDSKELAILLYTDDKEVIGLGYFIMDDNHNNYDIYFDKDKNVVTIKRH